MHSLPVGDRGGYRVNLQREARFSRAARVRSQRGPESIEARRTRSLLEECVATRTSSVRYRSGVAAWWKALESCAHAHRSLRSARCSRMSGSRSRGRACAPDGLGDIVGGRYWQTSADRTDRRRCCFIGPISRDGTPTDAPASGGVHDAQSPAPFRPPRLSLLSCKSGCSYTARPTR